MSGPVVLALRVVLAIALYAFLGATLWFLWQELTRTGGQIVRRRVPPIRLEVRTKRQTPIVRAFSQTEIILGRDPLVDVPLIDTAVSARHAVLSFHDGQWWLSDLGSKNGTRLNREQLTGPTVLTTGDEIKCGQANVTVILDTHPSGSGRARGGGSPDA